MSMCLCFFAGEGVVPEQKNEVEACEGRPAGECSPREGISECEERSAAAFWTFRDSWTAALCQVTKARNGGGQPRQWQKLTSFMTFHNLTRRTQIKIWKTVKNTIKWENGNSRDTLWWLKDFCNFYVFASVQFYFNKHSVLKYLCAQCTDFKYFVYYFNY